MKKQIIEDMFHKYYNDALLYTISLSKNEDLAKDIVSEAFFIALNNPDKEINNFKAWILKVCRNLYFNSLRKNKRIEPLEVDVKDEKESILNEIIRNEEYKLLYEAISKLNPAYNEVITLFYFEDLTIKEISKITSKSENAIKVNLFRARIALKNILS